MKSIVDTTRQAKVHRTDSDGFELANGKIAKDQGGRIRTKMTELFQSMEMLGSKMDSRSSNLEAQVLEGFEKEGRHRKQDYEDFEKKVMMKMEDGFKNEENARQTVRKGTGCTEG